MRYVLGIRKFLTYILTRNVAELVPYLAFVLFRIPLPLKPIQVLCVDMGTDSLTALGLGVERPDPNVMGRPPRPPRERLLNWPLAVRAYLFLGLTEAAAAMAAYFFVLDRGGWHYGDNSNSATGCTCKRRPPAWPPSSSCRSQTCFSAAATSARFSRSACMAIR